MGYLEDKRTALLMNANLGGGRLPSEYQQVEWIGNDSTNYFLLDENFLEMDYVEIECAIDDTRYDKYLVSNYPWNTGGNSRFAIGGTFENYFTCAYGNRDTGSSRLLPSTRTNNNFYKWVLDNKFFEIEDLNISLNVTDRTYSTSASTKLRFFGGYETNLNCYGKIKYYIQKRNGEVIVNLIPCYRKSDNEIGMYDTVTQTFFTNQGRGAFTKGNDV